MNKQYRRALFIFRRDLRLEDNLGLIYVLKNAAQVIACFIFTPEQIVHNPYKSDHCLQFMIESLEDLENALIKKGGKLYLFQGKPEKVVAECIEELKVEAVVVNRDYTPYSLKRDQKIKRECQKKGVVFHSLDDALLNPPEDTVKSDGKPYTVFTPYFRNASKAEIEPPCKNTYTNYGKTPVIFSETNAIYKKLLPHRSLKPCGGREAGLKILKNLEKFSDYSNTRNFPAQEGTTHLSAHLKFTTCSVREVYYAILEKIGPDTDLIRSLYWRDFFTSIGFYFPRVYSGAFHEKYDVLKWNSDTKLFKKWCKGETGFPFVDAGMRQMNQTGFMHNRLRMVVASFLVKDLHVDWRMGEKYFAQKLIDYDPALNNGNWQWCASTGCDAQPYFRIFNPWSQSLKFDPDCDYIKKWVPELATLPPEMIHNWHLEEYHKGSTIYPAPIVDHAKEAKNTLAYYKSVSHS